MKTNKLFIGALLLVGALTLQAQTVILTSATPSTSSTAGAGTSVFLGSLAGNANTTGSGGNLFAGFQAGRVNSSGAANVFLGTYAGQNNTISSYNIFIGQQAGSNNTNSFGSNVMIGHGAGLTNNGGGNVFIGHQSGIYTSGYGNVMIGPNVSGGGTTTTPYAGSEKLFIDNTNTATPLIYGDFAADQLKLNGKVGIGAVTSFPTTAGSVNVGNYRLFVTGGILADEVRINMSSGGTWADYVFNKNYNLKPLSEVESFIAANGHLPNVPSACQVEADGIALGEMSKIQQEKIEELTLYIIQMQKKIDALEKRVNASQQ